MSSSSSQEASPRYNGFVETRGNPPSSGNLSEEN